MGRSAEIARGEAPVSGSLSRNFTVSTLLAVGLLCVTKTGGAVLTFAISVHWAVCLSMLIAAIYSGKHGRVVHAAVFASLGALYANTILESVGLPHPPIELLTPGLLAFAAAIELSALIWAGRMFQGLGGIGLLLGLLGLLYGPSLGIASAPWGSEDYSLVWATLLPLAIVSLATITTRTWEHITHPEGMIALGLFPWLGYALLTLLWPAMLETWVGSPVTIAMFQAWLCVAPLGYVTLSARER